MIGQGVLKTLTNRLEVAGIAEDSVMLITREATVM